MQRSNHIPVGVIGAAIAGIVFAALAFSAAEAGSKNLTGGSCSGQGGSLVIGSPYISNGYTNANDADCGGYYLASSGYTTGGGYVQCQPGTWYYDTPSGKACLYIGHSMGVVNSFHNVCMELIPFTCSGYQVTSDT